MEVSRKSENVGGSLGVGRDLSVGGAVRMQGNVWVGHNVRIDGHLEAQNLKACSKGLFATADRLAAAYPRPRDGWWALVGDTLPAAVYSGRGGSWVATGEMAGEDLSIDLDYCNRAIADIRDEHDADVERIEAQHNAEMERVHAIIGEIGLDELDLTREHIRAVATSGTGAILYKVVDGERAVGTLEMFTDSTGHQITQVLTTNATLDGDGALDGGHVDDAVHRYRRNLGSASNICTRPEAAWSPWESQVADGLGDSRTVAISQAAVSAAITDARGLLAALEESLDELEAKHDGELGALEARVSGNASQITALRADVDSQSGRLTALGEDLRAIENACQGHGMEITTVKGRLNAVEDKVVENAEDIATLGEQIDGRLTSLGTDLRAIENACQQHGNSITRLSDRVATVEDKAIECAEDIGLHAMRLDQLERRDVEVDLSAITGVRQEPFDLAQAETEDYECCGFVPKPGDQQAVRHITRVWLNVAQESEASIFACTYQMSETQSMSCQCTQVAPLTWNAAGYYDTDLTLAPGEIYGFAFAARKVQIATMAAADEYPTTRTIISVASASAVAPGHAVTDAGVRYRKFWHAVGSGSITDPLEREIAQAQSSIGAVGERLDDTAATVQRFSADLQGVKYELYPLDDSTSDYPVFGFVPKPSDQLPVRHIRKVWLGVDGLQGCSIMSCTAEIDAGASTFKANTCRCVRLRPLTWNPYGWYDCDIEIGEGEYYGFVLPVAGHRQQRLDCADEYFGGAVINTMAHAQGIQEGQVFDKTNVRYTRLYHAVGEPSLFDAMQAQIDALSPVTRQSLFPRFEVRNLQSLRPHDMTWVEGQLWSFDKGANGGELSVYDSSLNLVAGQHRVFLSQDFLPDSFTPAQKYLEMKSVDYTAAGLLVGNGSSLFDSPSAAVYSRAYIFYSAPSWLEQTEAVTFDNCGDYAVIDLSALGHKTYALWSGSGGDTIMVIANYLCDIYQLQLGMGTDNLGAGAYRAAADNRHNGSYRVVRHWSQGATGALSFHGGQAYRGHLYIATNAMDSADVCRCVLNDDGTLQFDVLRLEKYGAQRASYSGGGVTRLQNCYIDGLCISDEHGLLAHTLHNVTGNLLQAQI